MKIELNKDLAKLNTFGINATCSEYISIRNEADLHLLFDRIQTVPKFFILGAGSNILIRDKFEGLVIHPEIQGIRILNSNDEYVEIECGAGVNWHEFVSICIKNKYFGLENLALIPGNVGAAPVQNIGAYGAEQKDFFQYAKCFDLVNGETIIFNADECRFAYRDSIFKAAKGKFLITHVSYKLRRDELPNLSYRELKQEIEKFVVVTANANYIFDTVCRLRKRKLPDHELLGNAGSFFKNPIIPSEDYHELLSKYPQLPSYNSNKSFKIPAAWLIEQCGWKGKRTGNVGVYEKHALILVNYGNAIADEIIALAGQIKDSVFEKFGIKLEEEVNII